MWIIHGPAATSDPHNMYGPSDPTGTWTTQQWGTYPPNQEMLPFATIPCSAVNTSATPPLTNCFRAVGQNMMLYRFTSSGNAILQIHSQGINQPCYNGVIAPGNEFDSLLAPTGTGPGQFVGFPTGVLNQPNLSTLSALTYSATMKLNYVAQNVLAACPPQGALPHFQAVTFMMAATFSTGVQTFFYQMAISRLGYNNLTAGGGWTNVVPNATFQFADDISFFANQPGAQCGPCSNLTPALNVPVTYTVNLLPRIAALIGTAPGGTMDPVLSHWSIGGMYVGHVTYGNIGAITEWSNIGYTGSTLAAQSIGLSATSVTLPGTANAGSFVATVNVTTSGGPYMGTLSLGGADASKFALSNGGMYPTNLMVGPVNLCSAATSPCTYNINITAP